MMIKIKNKFFNQRGSGIVFLALFIPLILAFAHLLFGGGFLSMTKGRLDNISKIAAIGALERYLASELTTHSERSLESLAIVNNVLSENSVPGLVGTLGPIGLAPGNSTGFLNFGTWQILPPTDPSLPTCLQYPCFIPFVSGSLLKVNAAEVKLISDSGSVNIPLVKSGRAVVGHSIVMSKNYSTIIIMDSSLSMTAQTHLNYDLSAANAAFPVYPSGFLTSTCTGILSPAETVWCAMANTRPAGAPLNETAHYKSDYRLIGPVAVDTFARADGLYRGPQPLVNGLYSANVALRAMAEISMPGDQWRVISARTTVPQVFPLESDPPLNDPGFLIQLLNPDNRGLWNELGGNITSTIHPNSLDYGLFPLPGDTTDATPLVSAINIAIKELEEQDPISIKRIILITDGVGNCSTATGCSDSFDSYLDSESEILNNVVPNLIAKKIALNVVLIGDHIEPHTINVPNPRADVGGEPYLSLSEASALGYKGVTVGGPYFFDATPTTDPDYAAWCIGNCVACNSSCEDRYAYNFIGKPNVKFRRAGAALGEAALTMMNKGLGKLCMIKPLNPDPAAYIDIDADPSTPKVLDVNSRISGQREPYSLVEGSPGLQILNCIDETPRRLSIVVVK